MREYAPDTFTENDVLSALDSAGLKHRSMGRYILSQCPLHDDVNPSVQIYKDDWFVKCHAGCEGGRFHITKAFPELRQNGAPIDRPARRTVVKAMPKYQDKSTEIMHMWESLPPIPDDFQLKLGLPADILNSHGWRYDEKHQRLLIPYWSRSKKSIPFAQWRNLRDDAPSRFNFWKDAKPTLYGTWNLEPGEKLFLVEGTSDAMVLDHLAVPWIAAPSAASGELVKAMGAWAKENKIEIVYAGDNDEAGNKLKDALDTVIRYRVKQPRYPYKDWSEQFEAEGDKLTINYCFRELFRGEEVPFPEEEPGYKAPEPEEQKKPEGWDSATDVEKVQMVFPGAKEIKIVGGEKKQLETPPTPLF